MVERGSCGRIAHQCSSSRIRCLSLVAQPAVPTAGVTGFFCRMLSVLDKLLASVTHERERERGSMSIASALATALGADAGPIRSNSKMPVRPRAARVGPCYCSFSPAEPLWRCLCGPRWTLSLLSEWSEAHQRLLPNNGSATRRHRDAKSSFATSEVSRYSCE